MTAAPLSGKAAPGIHRDTAITSLPYPRLEARRRGQAALVGGRCSGCLNAPVTHLAIVVGTAARAGSALGRIGNRWRTGAYAAYPLLHLRGPLLGVLLDLCLARRAACALLRQRVSRRRTGAAAARVSDFAGGPGSQADLPEAHAHVVLAVSGLRAQGSLLGSDLARAAVILPRRGRPPRRQTYDAQCVRVGGPYGSRLTLRPGIVGP
ncbi:hypothetical protein CSAL01_13050 [Colletotrichum salicis]|uniref:Uncharacterized protein n=1 Tax=Colletotrichum salicis TaxID=1209931 RepID=A0A135V7P8_9PEZI|nr:hypothetical protein CSAL01_13050 [Colletotrichum salicis]